MSISAVFDRVKWVKGYLAMTETEVPHFSSARVRPTTTFLTYGEKEPCDGMCSVGAIMWDLGAVKPDFSSRDFINTIPDDFERFVQDLRRFGVMIAQNYFYAYCQDIHPAYFETLDSYLVDTRHPLIESWNDNESSTEQEVRNFLYTLDLYPPYRQVRKFLVNDDSDELRELYAQADRLSMNRDFVREWMQTKVDIFNQIFDFEHPIPLCD